MGVTYISQAIPVRHTITLVLLYFYLVVPRVAQAESFQTIVIKLSEAHVLIKEYQEFAVRGLSTSPERLATIERKYADTRASFNAVISALIACSRMNLRDGPEATASKFDSQSLNRALNKVASFTEMVAFELQEDKGGLVRKTGVWDEAMKHLAIATILTGVAKFGQWVIEEGRWLLCLHCPESEAFIATLESMKLPAWQDMASRLSLTYDWNAFSGTRMAIATFVDSLVSVADRVQSIMSGTYEGHLPTALVFEPMFDQ